MFIWSILRWNRNWNRSLFNLLISLKYNASICSHVHMRESKPVRFRISFCFKWSVNPQKQTWMILSYMCISVYINNKIESEYKRSFCVPQVIAQDRNPLLSTANWGKMVQKVSQFGIRTGTFNCSSDSRWEMTLHCSPYSSSNWKKAVFHIPVNWSTKCGMSEMLCMFNIWANHHYLHYKTCWEYTVFSTEEVLIMMVNVQSS